jgi:hypothetical protein
MTGIYLLFATTIWLSVVIWLSKVSTEKLPKPTWRVPIAVMVFAVLLPLPLIDEIVGGGQFEQLCKENATIQVDRAAAIGKTVYLAKTPDVEIKGTWVRIVLQPRRFVDATTGETVVSFNDFIAVGGRFIQTLGISEGGVPLTFKGWCQPGDQYTLERLFRELQITLVHRPEKSNGATK